MCVIPIDAVFELLKRFPELRVVSTGVQSAQMGSGVIEKRRIEISSPGKMVARSCEI